MVTEALQPQRPDIELKTKAQRTYRGTFSRFASERLPNRVDSRRLKGYEGTDFQLSLGLESAKGEDPINLPASLQFLIAQVFRGFPVDDKTFEPKLRVAGVLFFHNRVAIDVEPTIETPKREGIESLFITFPDGTKAISSRVMFYIDGGSYVVNFGKPNGRSEWIFSDARPPRPYAGERHELTPEHINDLTSLARTISARPHSNLTLHRVH